MVTKRDFKCNQGEYGFVHTFNCKEEDGTVADVSWATGARLVIVDGDDGTTKLDITTNLSIVPSDKVQWSVQNGQTDFYSDNLILVVHLTASGRLEKSYDFPGSISQSKV